MGIYVLVGRLRGLVTWKVGIGVGFGVVTKMVGVGGLHPALISNT
jgi:hypothetical protein